MLSFGNDGSVTLELSAQLLVDAGQVPLPVTLRYSSTDPLVVAVTFVNAASVDPNTGATEAQPTTIVWRISRSLLAHGSPDNGIYGDVRIRREGLFVIVDLYPGTDMLTTIALPQPLVDAFLEATWRSVAEGQEQIDVDALIAQLRG